MNNPFNNMQYMQYIFSEYNKFKNNPIQWLSSRNINNPQQILQNPQQGFQNMINNGQVNNQQLNQIMSMAQMMQGMQGFFK